MNPCLDHDALVHEIERWLERDVVDARLRIRVTALAGALSFSIALSGDDQFSRSFDDLPTDCEGQRRAIGLSIALAVDAVAPAAPVASRQGRSWVLAVDGLVTSALPANLGLGAGAEASVALARWFRPTFGLAVAAASNSATASEPARFDSWLAAGRLEGCFTTSFEPKRRILGAACGGAWLGALTTAAHGLPANRVDSAFWISAAAALELHIRVTGSFGVHVGADALVPLRGSRVELLDSSGRIAAETPFPRLIGVLRVGPTIFF